MRVRSAGASVTINQLLVAKLSGVTFVVPSLVAMGGFCR